MRPGCRPQKSGDGSIEGPHRQPNHEHKRQVNDRWQACQAKTGNGCCQPANHHLALGPDVEQPGPEGKTNSKPSQDQRDGRGQCFGNGVKRAN